MKNALYLFLFFIYGTLNAQSINEELKAELDSIMNLDQSVRALLDTSITPEKKASLLEAIGHSEKEFYENPWGIIMKYDKSNQERVFQILEEQGYPGNSLVGTPTNAAAWYVIQHSDEIAKYLPLIKEAGARGELAMPYVAMMEDRHLMNTGREQIYGTQAYGSTITDPDTGKEEQVYFIWPISDPETVNERRKTIGYKTTIEEYAKKMDIEYRVYTIEEVKNRFKIKMQP